MKATKMVIDPLPNLARPSEAKPGRDKIHERGMSSKADKRCRSEDRTPNSSANAGAIPVMPLVQQDCLSFESLKESRPSLGEKQTPSRLQENRRLPVLARWRHQTSRSRGRAKAQALRSS